MWRKCVLIVALIASLELQGRLGSDINYEYWSLIAVQQFLRIISPKEKTPHMCSSIAAFAWDKIKLKVNFYHIKFYKEVKFDYHLKAKKRESSYKICHTNATCCYLWNIVKSICHSLQVLIVF